MQLFVAGYGNACLREVLTLWRSYPGQTSQGKRMLRSRSIFSSKLLSSFPEHVPLIVSRFANAAIQHSRKALDERDMESIRFMGDELSTMAQHDLGLRRIGALRVGSFCYSSWFGAFMFRKIWRLGVNATRLRRRSSQQLLGAHAA